MFGTVQTEEFKPGLNRLIQLLPVTPHPDRLVTMRAITQLLRQRLSPEARENPDTVIPKVYFYTAKFPAFSNTLYIFILDTQINFKT